MADNLKVAGTAVSPRRMLVPLALAQFICSFAGSNMNVMINDISKDLDTTVQGCDRDHPECPWWSSASWPPRPGCPACGADPGWPAVRLALGRHRVANREG